MLDFLIVSNLKIDCYVVFSLWCMVVAWWLLCSLNYTIFFFLRSGEKKARPQGLQLSSSEKQYFHSLKNIFHFSLGHKSKRFFFQCLMFGNSGSLLLQIKICKNRFFPCDSNAISIGLSSSSPAHINRSSAKNYHWPHRWPYVLALLCLFWVEFHRCLIILKMGLLQR